MEELTHLTNLENLPLSSNQKRLWLISQQNKLNPAYNLQLVYHLEGEISTEVMRSSLEHLFDRQHTLFSVFRHKGGVPYISINPRPVILEFVDFSGLPLQSAKENSMSFAGEQSRIPFNIEFGPLYRLFLLKEAEQSYYFCAIIHHLIFDGFSRRLFALELSRIYSNLMLGINEEHNPIKFYSYDFSALEKEESAHENVKEHVEFWKENLKGCPPELKFPYDFPRTSDPTGFGCREAYHISLESSQKLRALSRESDTSVFKILLSVLGILFNKCTGESDICIGIPVSVRRSPHSFKIFGFFVDTLPVRMVINETDSFINHISYSDDIIKKTLRYSLPFDKIVGLLKPERIPGLSPFFQISFSWINNFTIPMNLGGITGKRITVPNGVAPSDITFYMWEDGDRIEGEIEYNTDLIKRETIIRLRNNLLILVNNLLENPEASIQSIQLISDEERKLIESFNDTLSDYPREKTITQLFEEQVDIYPDKTAIVFKERSLTYKQLNEKANQLSRHLRDIGVAANIPVALMADKSVDLFVGIIGILKAGGCYTPVDSEYPLQRISFILKDSGCKILLTQEKFIDMGLEGITKLNLSDPDIYTGELSNPERINNSTDLAYILYTSGTTGVPKGTPIPQQGVVRLVRNTNFINFTAEDGVLQAGAIVFDASTFEIWGALLNGATLYVIDKETLLNTKTLSDIIVNNNISIVTLTSSLFTQIAESRTDLFYKVKNLVVGGDILSAFHVNKVRKDNPQLTVINAYGPTENSCTSTAYKVDRDFNSNIPIGRPVSNSPAYIFDKYLNYQPVGIIGELYVGGDGLSKGYLNREDLNKFCFIDNPNNPGERLYKTGDRARWLPDGNIEFHGRIDNQLKIRGFRVELDEIESVISEIDDVIETVIKPIKVQEGDYKLIAFLNVPGSFNMDENEIGKRIKARLPAYMVPSAYKFMHGFPKTINGKIDRKALTFNVNELEVIERIESKVLSPTEKILLDIWCGLLKTKDILTTDDFFNIGGNSLLVLSLINNIKEQTGVELSFKEVLTNPTIIQLGEYIENLSESKGKTIELIHLTEMVNLPLTSNQRRLWLISKMDPDVSSYIIPFTFKLSGAFNRNIFQQSLEKLFNRHHIVFSVIKELKGEPYCDIVTSKVDISFIDYSRLSEETKLDKIYELIEADSRKVFILNTGPLFRLYLIMTAQDEYYFHLSIHHIVFDGWSCSVFVNDLSEIYNSLIRGKEIDLEKIEFQEYDYAHWEKISAGTENEKKSIEFWEENLNGASPILNFPYDFKRKENPSGRGSHESIHLSKDLSEKLRHISLAEGSSLFTTLFSAFGIQMHKYSGEDDLNIGLPVAYRPHSKLENIFGMFVNTVVVRLKYAKGLTFKNILKQTSEATLNAIAHQDLAFDKVVEIINPERSFNVNPLFQVAFAWQNNLYKPIKLDGIRSERIAGNDRSAEFDITLSLWENEGFIEGTFEYNIDILKPETIIRLRDNFITLLENLMESSDTPIESVPMMSDEERAMIDGFNNTRTNYPKDKTLIQLFEDQVNLYPLKTAVVFKNSSLTYSQLNEKANQLSLHLRDLGVASNIPVAIMADKSIDLFVGIIGIIKAGGCYTPLDSDYPLQRIRFILKDSGCKILLTQSSLMEMDLDGITKLNLNDPDLYTGELSNPEKTNDSTDLAYILYTSGTTGVPKGTPIPHQGVVRLVRNTNFINFTFEDRVLQSAAVVFDASALEIWGALLNGGTLYIIDRATLLNAKTLGEVIVNNNISIVTLTSAFFTQVAEAHTDIFNKVKNLIVGGDVLSALHVNKVRKYNPQLTVINAYGPTENSCMSTAYIVDRDFDSNIPIGRPVSNSPAYIFDKYLNYQPIGIIGELYVGGDGLSKGYLNREDLNKVCFIENPHNPGERIYKTGDHARWLPDGNIEFHGRIDNQLKIRGFRIELDEIESVISEIDEVIETVIKPVKVQDGDYKLIAFLNVTDSFRMDVNEIGRIVRTKLPEYMVPSAYKLMHGFPKTINGKIDKKALEYDESELKLKERKEDGILSPTEKALLNIWCDALKTKNILSTDNFFNIGGNSLLAVNVFSKIMSEFKLDLDLRIFFDSPFIKDLAETIDISLNADLDKDSFIKPDDAGSSIIKGEI